MAEEKIKENENEKEIDAEEKTSKKEKKALDKLKEELEISKEETQKWKNKYYEAYADMDNLRKKMDKDHEMMVKYRGQGFLEALIPVFDNFYNCFKYKPEDPKLAAYCQGFEMIYNQMLMAIEHEGVKEFLPKIGDDFDASKMMAVDTVEGEDNKVVKVVSKGYYLRDRLVRASGVVVSKKKQEEVKEEKDLDKEAENEEEASKKN